MTLKALSTRRPSAWVNVLILTLGSQAISALAIVLLKLLGAATADRYAVGIQLGLASFTGVTVGVIYNLAVGRRNWPHWRRAALISAAVQLVLLLGMAIASVLGLWGLDRSVLPVLVAFGLGGAALAFGGAYGVRLACLGRPGWLSVTTVYPNLALCLAIPVVSILDVGELVPAIAWLLGSLLSAVLVLRRSRQAPAEGDSGATSGASRHAAVLSVGVVASTVVPLVLLGAATQLAVGAVSTLLIVARFITSGVGLGVNSLLLVHYKWDEDRLFGLRVVSVVVPIGLAAQVLALVSRFIWPDTLVAPATAALGWALLAVASAIVVRATNARRLTGILAVKVGADVLLSVLALGVFIAYPSAMGFFAVFTVNQAVTVAVCARGLRRLTSSLGGVIGVGLGFLQLMWG